MMRLGVITPKAASSLHFSGHSKQVPGLQGDHARVIAEGAPGDSAEPGLFAVATVCLCSLSVALLGHAYFAFC